MGGSNSKSRRKENYRYPPTSGHNFQYDFIVIGGGSGGIAAAKEAQSLGQKVAVCDFIKPSPFGTTWGLGGTCVNVGCIPKKLMHTAALTAKAIGASGAYGFTIMPHPSEEEAILEKLRIGYNWKMFVDNVNTYIKSLNWTTKVILKDKHIDYMNEYAQFQGLHTLLLTNKNNETRTISGNIILLANGGRPKYMDIPGGRFADALCITSDDLFSLPFPPGKTLVIGASYVALECAGFLVGLGFQVTVMVRSAVLRGFDPEIAAKVTAHIKSLGVRFLFGYEPVEVKKLQDGKPPTLRIKYKAKADPEEDDFNTILLAVGRACMTANMGLDEVGVKFNPLNGKIVVNGNDQSSVTHIFAVGDAADGIPEFSPIAVHAGKYLAKRLFTKGFREYTDYETYPTTIFTPIEYGCIGLSEDKARQKYGADNLRIFQSNFSPLEEDLPGQIAPGTCFIKLICVRKLKELVVGLHYFGPNAGEVVQGYAIAFYMGAKKSDYDAVIGIHPTCSERFTTLHIAKGEAGEGELTSC